MEYKLATSTWGKEEINANKLHDHGLFVGNSHADLTKELHYLKRILE
jgi:hypothetical protein